MDVKFLISSWKEAKAKLEELKKLELTLRNDIIQEMGDTDKFEVGDDVFTIKRVTTYKVNEPELNQYSKELAENFIDIGSLFKVKHGLSVRDYKALSAEQKDLVDKVITIKDGQPSLSFTTTPKTND